MSFPYPYLLFIGDENKKANLKTALGLIQWCPEKCLAYDSLNSNCSEISIPQLNLREAKRVGAKSIVIGVAPSGGKLPEHWDSYIEDALKLGLNVINGLHDYLNDNPIFKNLAKQNNVEIYDIRKPQSKYLVLGTGERRTGRRLLTVGTDGVSGKKYTALAIHEDLKKKNINSDFRATGQTGIMITGEGVAIDSVPGDFICGASETLCPANDSNHWDIIEGQGCLLSPTASSLLGFVNGTQPDTFIMCHDVARKSALRPPYGPSPEFKELMEIYLYFARRKIEEACFKGFSINTSSLSERDALTYLSSLEEQYNLPATDPIRFGIGKITDFILS